MIQRIQSIYLLLSSILIAVSIFSPIAEISNASGSMLFYAKGLVQKNGVLGQPTWPILAMALVAILTTLATLFLFKKRKFQMRIAVYSIRILIGQLIMIAYYVYTFQNGSIDTFSYRFAIITPLIALVFNLLAFLAITRDENLVRSLDRLR